MNRKNSADKESRLFALLAKPLTRMILSILIGIDPGKVSDDILKGITNNLHRRSKGEFEYLANDDD